MSKIENTVYEIHKMNDMTERDQWMNQIHPLVKFILTVAYILLLLSIDKYELVQTVGMGVFLYLQFLIGEVSVGLCIKRLKYLLPFLCIVGIFNPIYDRELLLVWGGIEITGGMVSMVTLMLKGIFALFSAYLLMVTTGMEKICYGMSCLHVPNILVTIVLFIHRYLTVLLEEAYRIARAYSLRAPGQRGIHYKVWGSLLGQLLLRSMDRAETVYESMCLRGYGGEIKWNFHIKITGKDVAYGMVSMILLFAVRLLPIFQMIGTIVM